MVIKEQILKFLTILLGINFPQNMLTHVTKEQTGGYGHMSLCALNQDKNLGTEQERNTHV